MTTVKINNSQILLRKIALIVILIGWVVSLGFTIQAGSKNRSVILIILFLGWVSSPFVGLSVAALLSRRWLVVPRMVLCILMIFIAICSVVGYSGALSPAGMKPAFVFLVIPLISWILIVIIIPVVISRAGKKNGDQRY
jgi:uncharacterized membrane protein YhaH (DUF805 family)